MTERKNYSSVKKPLWFHEVRKWEVKEDAGLEFRVNTSSKNTHLLLLVHIPAGRPFAVEDAVDKSNRVQSYSS